MGVNVGRWIRMDMKTDFAWPLFKVVSSNSQVLRKGTVCFFLNGVCYETCIVCVRAKLIRTW